jgi:hypothetical protein
MKFWHIGASGSAASVQIFPFGWLYLRTEKRCQQGKGNRRRSKLTITNPDAAGIDIGAQVHYVSVPEDRAEVSVRSFARANHIGPKTSVKDLRVLRPKIALLPFDHAG